MIDTRHERPLWKWILLFVGSTFLAMFGYGLLQGIFLLTDEAGLPYDPSKDSRTITDNGRSVYIRIKK